MPAINVKTTPVRGVVRIYGVRPGYNLVAWDTAPVKAERLYPWSYCIELEPVVVGGNLWMPELYQERGVARANIFKTYRYFNMGPV